MSKVIRLEDVLSVYGLKEVLKEIVPFGRGLINRTWKVTTEGRTYILQQVNDTIFQNPETIAGNIGAIASYLKERYPSYFFVAPVTAADGRQMIFLKEKGFFRLFPFVEGSHSIDVVSNPDQAWEASKQFGLFTQVLSEMDASRLKETIPGFHNLSLRFKQFLKALEQGTAARREKALPHVQKLLAHYPIVRQYELIMVNPAFRLRLAHHDTKISNVLFDEHNKGLCVIDLDTVMPGFFISDVGDMMRTYLSPVSEEEEDFSKIEIREEVYRAVVDGYYSAMKTVLSEAEKACFFYAGQFMIYMQSLRFCTDYLNNDFYYGAQYKEHNLVRSQNQLILLERLLEKENSLAHYW